MADVTSAANAADYPDTPAGWAARWSMEFGASKKHVEKWQEQSEKIVNRYLDKEDRNRAKSTKWNLFTSDVNLKRALFYGRTPQVEVGRRHQDSQDQAARVASEMLERLLNTDIERDSDSFAVAMGHALDDLLLPGLGSARLRYVADFEAGEETPAKNDDEGNELAPAVPAQERKSREDVEVDYVYWRDQLWSPCRTFHEVRWWAFKAEMSREAMTARFGEDVAKVVPLNSKRAGRGSSDNDAAKADPWSRADVWEVWSKEHKRVFWFVEGYPAVLDSKEDPLELEGFWPFARPMIANATTSNFIPQPDFILAQDLYDEIDLVSTRIMLLERCIAVRGVYDKNSTAVKRLIDEAGQNELIPVEGWNAFAEKGGVKGAVDWLPLDMVVAAIDKLRDLRLELKQALFEITGMSDIMRGQQAQNGTPGEASVKARFSSVRVQSQQDEFARFASDTQRLKAEIIAKHFDPQTIIDRSNVLRTPDAQLAQQAVALIKDEFSAYRVQVKPEAVALTDFAALKAERVDFIQAITGFVTGMAPVAQAMPGSMPFLLQILQWAMAGFKGSSTIEGVLDQAIAQANAQAQAKAAMPPQPPPPDPKILAVQAKAQADMAHQQMESQANMMRMQAEQQAETARQERQFQIDTALNEQKAQLDLRHQAAQEMARASRPAPMGKES